MWWVFEAEFEVENDPAIPAGKRKILWDRPVKETIAWHGPFYSEKDANEAGLACMWAKVDLAYHGAKVVEVNMPMASEH